MKSWVFLKENDAKEKKGGWMLFSFFFTKGEEMSRVGSRDRHTWWRSKRCNFFHSHLFSFLFKRRNFFNLLFFLSIQLLTQLFSLFFCPVIQLVAWLFYWRLSYPSGYPSGYLSGFPSGYPSRDLSSYRAVWLSIYIISLSYPMAVFSVNLFRLF